MVTVGSWFACSLTLFRTAFKDLTPSTTKDPRGASHLCQIGFNGEGTPMVTDVSRFRSMEATGDGTGIGSSVAAKKALTPRR
ncbi:hypothetical protein J1N35_028205 [Gossypium stocksii]|uniref:Secreted protein n=1 Tax=Gossypium stocksii TaxID=47602 RepID=A0A9D3ZRW6_9ROSI|nr:hypothetical protein J1N35_028205 [Gossypium stocksii]